MKQTLSTGQAANMLREDEYAGWSYAGALALVEWLEAQEDDLGEDLEMDVVALRCDFSEKESLYAWAKEYFAPEQYTAKFSNALFANSDERNEAISDYIEGRGSLITFDGGIIVSSF